MKIREDLITIIRGILKRPVESLLLIFGIALGIGATASGITIVFRSQQQAEKRLDQTRFREIVVNTRESAAEMELPAEETGTEEEIVLTANDLAAKLEVPGVQYAYIANREHMRFGGFGRNADFINRQFRENNQTGDRQAGDGQPGNINPGDMPGGESAPPPGEGEDRPPLPEGMPRLPEGMDFRGFKPDPEAMQPAIEEMDSYRVSPEYFAAYGLTAARGSLFTEVDVNNREPVLILGSELAKTMFADGIVMQRKVQVQRDLYTIIGVLEPTGTDLDSNGFIPIAPPADPNMDFRMRMRNWNTSLRFTVAEAGDLEQAKAQLTAWFDRAYGVGRVAISVPREEAEALADRNSRLVTIILILALSGLLIASVNVSNILYSRAIRKRKSIGIFKALGATRMHIFRLFFTEALIVGIGGAAAGTGVAILLSGLMQTSMGIGGYSLGVLGLGVLLSLATTLFLTNIPAVQTSKIPASEAIRYE